MKVQRIAIASLVLIAAGLSACSSTSKTSVAGSTTLPAVTVPDTAPPDTAPPDTAAPDTNPPDTQPPATDPPTPALYDQVPSPNVPGGHTDPFASNGVLGDGVYWVLYNGGETFTPDITVVQAFFGQECIDMAASQGETCENDIYVLDPPSRDIDDLPFAANVNLTIADACNQMSYWITPDELRSVRASSPSVDTAPDCVFTPFPFLMTVENGEITKFEQVWTP